VSGAMSTRVRSLAPRPRRARVAARSRRRRVRSVGTSRDVREARPFAREFHPDTAGVPDGGEDLSRRSTKVVRCRRPSWIALPVWQSGRAVPGDVSAWPHDERAIRGYRSIMAATVSEPRRIRRRLPALDQ
jgi:hypothetical protein